MVAGDNAFRTLGMQLLEIALDAALLKITAHKNIFNVHQTCHGGLIYVLADPAFAFACNSHNELPVALSFSIDFWHGASGRCADRLMCRSFQDRRHRRLRHRSDKPAWRIHRRFSGPVLRYQGKAGCGPGCLRRGRFVTVKLPTPGDLEPIEQASRDEITALQLQRLRTALQQARCDVPHYRLGFDNKGVYPTDLKQFSCLFPFSVYGQKRSAL